MGLQDEPNSVFKRDAMIVEPIDMFKGWLREYKVSQQYIDALVQDPINIKLVVDMIHNIGEIRNEAPVNPARSRLYNAKRLAEKIDHLGSPNQEALIKVKSALINAIKADLAGALKRLTDAEKKRRGFLGMASSFPATPEVAAEIIDAKEAADYFNSVRI